MKTTYSLHRVALVALALGTASVTATFAQTTSDTSTTTTTTPATPGEGWHHHHHHGSVLTAAEKTELKTAKESVFASNGSLKTQAESLKQQAETLRSEGKSVATKAQWQALHQQKVAFRQQLRSAELLIDPNLSAIFAKLDAAHKAWQQSGTSTSTPSST